MQHLYNIWLYLQCTTQQYRVLDELLSYVYWSNHIIFELFSQKDQEMSKENPPRAPALAFKKLLNVFQVCSLLSALV